MARGREEWDSALLQNTNTKCNGLLPLWGPQVPEAAFASCLARSASRSDVLRFNKLVLVPFHLISQRNQARS